MANPDTKRSAPHVKVPDIRDYRGRSRSRRRCVRVRARWATAPLPRAPVASAHSALLANPDRYLYTYFGEDAWLNLPDRMTPSVREALDRARLEQVRARERGGGGNGRRTRRAPRRAGRLQRGVGERREARGDLRPLFVSGCAGNRRISVRRAKTGWAQENVGWMAVSGDFIEWSVRQLLAPALRVVARRDPKERSGRPVVPWQVRNRRRDRCGEGERAGLRATLSASSSPLVPAVWAGQASWRDRSANTAVPKVWTCARSIACAEGASRRVSGRPCTSPTPVRGGRARLFERGWRSLP